MNLQLGNAVYDGIVQPGIDAESILSTLGGVYGTLLKSIALENHIIVRCRGLTLFPDPRSNTCPVAGSVRWFLLCQRSFTPILACSVRG